jgi:hypothetical protein
MTDKALFIPLKTEYYEAFKSGRKNTEFRRYGSRWNESTCTVGRQVTISKGYGKQNRLEGEVVGFEVKKGIELDNKEAIKMIYGTLNIEIACIKIKLNEVVND